MNTPTSHYYGQFDLTAIDLQSLKEGEKVILQQTPDSTYKLLDGLCTWQALNGMLLGLQYSSVIHINRHNQSIVTEHGIIEPTPANKMICCVNSQSH